MDVVSTPLVRRRRPTWPELPGAVRTAIEGKLGATVDRWRSCDGGYSPGLASVLETVNGPAFVKATGPQNDYSRQLYRQEAQRAAALPRTVPAPAFRWVVEVEAGQNGVDGTWVAIASDAVPGRAPRTPWVPEDLDALISLARRIAGHAIPAGALPEAAEELATASWAKLASEGAVNSRLYDPWVRTNLDRLLALAAPVAEAVAGPFLVHGDLRGDNALIIEDSSGGLTAVAVDWPYAFRGAAFIDAVAMLPSVQIGGGPAPEEVLARLPLPSGSDADAVTCYLAHLTGYFVHASLRPPPQGIPHVRAFQRAQGEACIGWLRRRLGA
jgi:hypothetical protein